MGLELIWPSISSLVCLILRATVPRRIAFRSTILIGFVSCLVFFVVITGFRIRTSSLKPASDACRSQAPRSCSLHHPMNCGHAISTSPGTLQRCKNAGCDDTPNTALRPGGERAWSVLAVQ